MWSQTPPELNKPHSAWVMPPMSHFCQMGRVWPAQASAGPCSPPCSSDPVEGNLGFCITAFQKERKSNFSQRKYLLLISVNMREMTQSPTPPFMPPAYLNSHCHIRGSSESGAGCGHNTQLGFTRCPPQDHQHPMITCSWRSKVLQDRVRTLPWGDLYVCIPTTSS